jgi:alkylation response protein AidB-like acyl-CoA dehydrogenase
LESPTGEIAFDEVLVDPAWIIDADGKSLLDLAFVRERVLAPWPLLGKMAREIQAAIDFIGEREQFGKPIAGHQYVQDKIVQSYQLLATSRLVARQALDELMAGRGGHALASLAKYHVTDAAVAVFRHLIETYGSRGLRTEAGLGRYLSDALCATVAGGTREMHKRVLFDQLMLDRARSRRRGRSKLFAITSVRPREEESHV